MRVGYFSRARGNHGIRGQRMMNKEREGQGVGLAVGSSLTALSPEVLAGMKEIVNQVVVKPRNQPTSSSSGGVALQVISNTTGPIAVNGCPEKKFTYKVKIVNPNKRNDFVIRHLNHCTTKLPSVAALRVQLSGEFKDQVPTTDSFNVGYFDGNQQSKVLLVTDNDLDTMYRRFGNGGLVTLWCDGRSTGGTKRKRDEESAVRRREQDEDENSYYRTLIDKHKDKCTTPQYRLWAKMQVNGLHDDLDTPPNIPSFSNPPKRQRTNSLSDSLTGAAIAFANTLSQGPNTIPVSSMGVSPGKTIELRMKSYQQLRYLQQLYDDGIIDEEDFKQQKKNVLGSLRSLSPSFSS